MAAYEDEPWNNPALTVKELREVAKAQAALADVFSPHPFPKAPWICTFFNMNRLSAHTGPRVVVLLKVDTFAMNRSPSPPLPESLRTYHSSGATSAASHATIYASGSP